MISLEEFLKPNSIEEKPEKEIEKPEILEENDGLTAKAIL